MALRSTVKRAKRKAAREFLSEPSRPSVLGGVKRWIKYAAEKAAYDRRVVEIALKNARIDAKRPFRSPIVDRNYVDDIFDRFKPAPVVVRDVSQPRTQRAGSLSGSLREAERRETINGRQRAASGRLDSAAMRDGSNALRSSGIHLREVKQRRDDTTERLARNAGNRVSKSALIVPTHGKGLVKVTRRRDGEMQSPGAVRDHDDRNSDDRMRDRRNCKERPDPNKERHDVHATRSGRGGGSREFVPWCD